MGIIKYYSNKDNKKRYSFYMKNNVIRKCAGCKELKNRDDLIKITLKDSSLFINPDSKTMGRSVYVCKNESCIKAFIKTKGIKRSLKFNNDEAVKKTEAELLNLLSC